MGKLTVLATRIVLAMVIVGTLFLQVVLVADLANVPWELSIFMFLGFLLVEVAVVCVWQLLTMVRRGTVFSQGAFRYVDVIIGAAAAGSVLAFALGVALAPGDAPPGVVALAGGAGVLIAGIALVVLVMRMLLAQAVAREVEARNLRTELDEVI
jgi:hypothetical protein